MAWTTQQKTAIEARGSGLIVSAAAGSGKTSVLVERLTQIISDREHPVPIERMIVVTFTKDAASEMKQRLSASLERAISAAPEDTWLRRQQMLLSGARISTINAFCFDFIREHIGDGEITSGFRVLDDAEQELLRAKAADAVIGQWHKTRKDDMRILWDAFCGKTDAPLEGVLLDLHTFFGSIPFREVWLRKALAEYAKPMRENLYYCRMIERYRSEIAAIRKLCDRAVYLAADLYATRNNVLDWVMTDSDSIAMLYKLLHEESPDGQQICLYAEQVKQMHDGARYPSIRKKDVTSIPRFDAVRDLRGQYAERLKELLNDISSMLPYFEDDMAQHRKLLPLLAEMEQDLSDVLWRMKAERNGLSFDDGERLTLQLLSEVDEDGTVRQSALAKEMSEYYQLIMIDEYQDSNNKQDYIFKLLSRNCTDPETGALRYGDNVFLVGDVKQCIYQFRMANPRNFSAAASAAKPYSAEETAPLQLIHLNRNFRSSGQVIAFVNLLFARLMSEQCGDVVYDENEWLYPGALDYQKLPEEEQAVEIAILPEKDENEEPADAALVYTAETIRKMLDEKYPVMQRDGTTRPCTPEDFCVLLRNKSPAKEYVRALEQLQIPAKGTEETGYLKSKEISLLLNLLRVLDNPLLETPLAAVMLSPMFSFTADDLASIRLADRSQNLYGAMCWLLDEAERSPEQLPCEVALLEKCRSLHAVLQQLRYDSALYTLEMLLRRIYETTDFLSVMQLYQDGEKKRANLHLLLQYARQYEENMAGSSYGGITGFLRYIDSMLEKGRDLQQASSSGGSDSVVAVKTMHGSKGLEYPFVFVCRTETEFSKLDNQKKMHCTDSGMTGFRLQNPETLEKYQSLPYQTILQEKRKQTCSEEMRLLYVALTRAKQKLFLPMRYGEAAKNKLTQYAELLRDSGEIPAYAVSGANSMADWIWMSLMMQGDEAFQQLVPEAEGIGGEEKRFPELHLHYTNVYESAALEPQAAAPMPQPRQEVIEAMDRMMQHHYQSEELGQVSLLSVSAVSKSDQSGSLTMKRPRCIRSEKRRLTGAEHGTAVHAFFQYCRFSSAEKDAPAEVRYLHQMGYLTEEQMHTIRAEEIEPFFRHPLYLRMRSAPQLLRERKFLVRLSDLQIPETLSESDLQALLQYRYSRSMMKGIIDLAFWDGDGYVLVDYKTDAVTEPQVLTERYRMQLYIYRLALEQMTGKRVKECWIYSTCLNDAVAADCGQ
ncbi:MAG: helicase-exonuclease AddAB subunit AddA [Ruminococcus sp.]|nr:helicase-exonuclease AddAB subunit AddA [Ruminococcus sp.]